MKKIIMILCTLIIIGIGTLFILKNNEDKKNNPSISNSNSNLIVGNKPFYSRAGRIDINNEKFENKIVKNFDEYKQILDKYEIQYDLSEKDFSNYEYYAFVIENDDCGGSIVGVEDATIQMQIKQTKQPAVENHKMTLPYAGNHGIIFVLVSIFIIILGIISCIKYIIYKDI